MKELSLEYKITEYKSLNELQPEYRELLKAARKAANGAYAPYSKFKVGATVLLKNGKVVVGSNQENGSYPAGICAERVALTAASAQHPNVAIKAVAITAKGDKKKINTPISPCGICRQTILEYELKYNRNIELILQGETGKIYLIPSSKILLPLFFSGEDIGNV